MLILLFFFFWTEGILKQVKDYIKQCSKCQEKLDRSRPISDASEMLEELGLDLESGEESNESEDDLSNFTSAPTTASKSSKKKPVSKHELVFVSVLSIQLSVLKVFCGCSFFQVSNIVRLWVLKLKGLYLSKAAVLNLLVLRPFNMLPHILATN